MPDRDASEQVIAIAGMRSPQERQHIRDGQGPKWTEQGAERTRHHLELKTALEPKIAEKKRTAILVISRSWENCETLAARLASGWLGGHPCIWST